MAGQARVAGQEILRKKGATSFGIGAALVRVIRTILRNEQTVLTVSGIATVSASLGQARLGTRLRPLQTRRTRSSRVGIT
jgi:L-lactate dehydrogenase